MSSSIQYPANPNDLEVWNTHIRNLTNPCRSLLLDYSDHKEKCESFFKVFNTLKLDNIKPSVFIDHYAEAIGNEKRSDENISTFVRKMTLMFLGHSTSHELSESPMTCWYTSSWYSFKSFAIAASMSTETSASMASRNFLWSVICETVRLAGNPN